MTVHSAIETARASRSVNALNPSSSANLWRQDVMIFGVLMLIVSLFNTVEVMSVLSEAVRDGVDLDTRIPVATEATSGLAMMVPTLLLMALHQRLYKGPASLWLWVVFIVAGCVVFSLLHVSQMVAFRKVVFQEWIGIYYQFGTDLKAAFIYEFRKDLLAFLLFLGAVHGLRWGFKRSKMLAPAAKIPITSGSTTVIIDPAELLFIKAAANYAEIHTRSGEHMVRGTLKSLERLMTENGVEVLRVHRSYLVARQAILRIEPTPAGDIKLLLWDGHIVLASRRYKDALTELRSVFTD